VETHFAFDWDPKKAALNRRKHRISFEEARTVFSGPAILTVRDTGCAEFGEGPGDLGTRC